MTLRGLIELSLRLQLDCTGVDQRHEFECGNAQSVFEPYVLGVELLLLARLHGQPDRLAVGFHPSGLGRRDGRGRFGTILALFRRLLRRLLRSFLRRFL